MTPPRTVAATVGCPTCLASPLMPCTLVDDHSVLLTERDYSPRWHPRRLAAARADIDRSSHAAHDRATSQREAA